jgi:hypothetical protein
MKKFFKFAKRGFRHKKTRSDQKVSTSVQQHNSVPVQQAKEEDTFHTLPIEAAPADQFPDPRIPQVQIPLEHNVHTAAGALGPSVTATNPTLDVAMVNRSTSSNVFAYITGLASSNNNALFLLQADGTTGYYPKSPPMTGQPLQADCAIKLGPPGSSRTVTIPQVAGGRIWFSFDNTLTFLLNPGPALVEPSVTNPTDPNININWGFAEFTYNSTQIYANISYVDFVSLPISLMLQDGTNAERTVTGMRASGFDQICAQMQAQSQTDGVKGWANCIVQSNGANLRVLSPNNRILLQPSDFANYWEPYVAQVWQKYQTDTLTVGAENVNATGKVVGDLLNLSGEDFARPSTADIFSANSGPFTTGADGRRNQLIPQLAAAFNRSTLLQTDVTPAPKDTFYNNPITNHYSRIVHAANVDGIGYGFPYDDVEPPGGGDQSGYVSGANPKLLTVTVGGGQYS